MVFSVDSSEVVMVYDSQVMVYDSQVVMNSDRVLSTQSGIGIGSDETGVCAGVEQESQVEVAGGEAQQR